MSFEENTSAGPIDQGDATVVPVGRELRPVMVDAATQTEDAVHERSTVLIGRELELSSQPSSPPATAVTPSKHIIGSIGREPLSSPMTVDDKDKSWSPGCESTVVDDDDMSGMEDDDLGKDEFLGDQQDKHVVVDWLCLQKLIQK